MGVSPEPDALFVFCTLKFGVVQDLERWRGELEDAFLSSIFP